MIFKNEGGSNIKRVSSASIEAAPAFDARSYLTPEYISRSLMEQSLMLIESERYELYPLYFSKEAKLRACGVPMIELDGEEFKKAAETVQAMITKWAKTTWEQHLGIWDQVCMMKLANPEYFQHLSRSQRNTIHTRIRDLLSKVKKQPQAPFLLDYLFAAKIIDPENVPELSLDTVSVIDISLPSEDKIRSMSESFFADMVERYGKLRILIPSKPAIDSPAFNERMRKLLESNQTKEKGRTLNYCFDALLAQASTVAVDEHGLRIGARTVNRPANPDVAPVPPRRNL